jgi:long-chain acyl-CoA synthetase
VQKLLWHEVAGFASRTPQHPAIISDDATITYAELVALAAERGAQLAAAGVAVGDRVALVAGNSPSYLVWAFAIWRAGAVLATVYPESSDGELDYILSNARATCVIADASRTGVVTDAVARSARSIAVYTIDAHGHAAGLPPAGPLPELDVDPDAVALICYTSGSSAAPKPVAHSHRGLAGACRTYARAWRMTQTDRTLVCLPMAWIYGLLSASLVTLVAGGTVVPLARFNPVRVIDAIERHAVTVFPGVTTMYVKIVSYLKEAHRRPQLTSLRFNVSGGEPRNEAVFDEWVALGGLPVLDSYCASECLPAITYDPDVDPEPRPGSAGRVVPGAAMKVVDQQGAPVTAGKVGLALWRSPGMMVGYWNEPELTEAAMTPDGWYKTGDYVRVDEDGYVFIVGRATDMIIYGGTNVSPVEVEAALTSDPRIAEAAVVGLPDSEYGQIVAAAVVTADGSRLSEDDLTRLCAARLAVYKIPKVFVQVDQLPRGATGKVKRRDAAALFQPLRRGAGNEAAA